MVHSYDYPKYHNLKIMVEQSDVSCTMGSRCHFYAEKIFRRYSWFKTDKTGFVTSFDVSGLTIKECCDKSTDLNCCDYMGSIIERGKDFSINEFDSTWGFGSKTNIKTHIIDNTVISYTNYGKEAPDIEVLGSSVDAMIVIPNNRVFSHNEGSKTMINDDDEFTLVDGLFLFKNPVRFAGKLIKGYTLNNKFKFLTTGETSTYNKGDVVLTPFLVGCCIIISKQSTGVVLKHSTDCSDLFHKSNLDNDSHKEIVFFPFMTDTEFISCSIMVKEKSIILRYITLSNELYNFLAGDISSKEITVPKGSESLLRQLREINIKLE